MARRGDKLHEHILWTAKDIFLELGFERTSMDVVASRAETSKRSLYAHFESKEKLFLAVIDLVRRLFLSRLRMPEDYSDQPTEALVMFCAQYLKFLLYEYSIQMIRVSMAESTRFPEGAAQYFDVIFTEVHAHLCTYLMATFGVSPTVSSEVTQKLLGQVLYPRLLRALFGMDPLVKSLDDEALSPEVNLTPIHLAVADLLSSLQEH